MKDNLVNNYAKEIIELVVQYALKYYQNIREKKDKGGIPPPPEVFAKAVEQTKKSNDPVKIWFEEYYETGNGEEFQTSRHAMLELAREMKIKELVGESRNPLPEKDSERLLNENMKNMEFNYVKDLARGFGKKWSQELGEWVYIKGGFKGFRRKKEEEEVVVEETEIPMATAVGVRLVDAGK